MLDMTKEQQRGQLSWNGVSEEVAENEVTEVDLYTLIEIITGF